MYKVYLLLGSNMGDRQAMLDSANLELIDALLPDYLEVASLGDAVNTSQVMETQPWGFDTPVEAFLNQSFCCLTEYEPEQVLEICQRIESELGRERKEPQFDSDGKRIYHSREIDIDILAIEIENGGVWEPVQVNLPHLVVPHPQLESRDFAKRLFQELKDVKPAGKKKVKK
jgi:2-amino-4-hydroxy-6-hydroxymethyldihydropteridine diphosphokinase